MSARRNKFAHVVLILLSGTIVVLTHADDARPRDVASMRHRVKVEQYQRTERYKIEVDRHRALQTLPDDIVTHPSSGGFDRSIMVGRQIPASPYRSGSAAAPPPPSPGFDFAFTAYDLQSNGSQGHNVARTPTGPYIHFTWMTFREIPGEFEDLERTCAYTSINPVTMPPPDYNGTDITTAEQRGGYVDIDVTSTNHAQIALHMKEQAGEYYKPWHFRFPFEGSATYDPQPLEISTIEDCQEWLWPRLAADRSGQVIHEIAHDNDNPVTGPGTPPPPGGSCLESKLYYWRFDPSALDGNGAWTGPALLDTTRSVSYCLAVDDVGEKVGVVTHAEHPTDPLYPVNVYFLESIADGVDWINAPTLQPRARNYITNYTDPNGPQAWYHLTAAYDHNSVLHIAYDEQRIANQTGQCAIMHWNSLRNTTRPVALGYWDNEMPEGRFDLTLTKLSLGIGDGSTLCKGGTESNQDYVYITWCQFGGESEAEQQDYSGTTAYEGRSGGFMNGEVYLAVSNSSGDTWSPPTNLTNTKTPGCYPGPASPLGVPQFPDSVCRSEMWATLGRVVSDIDIFFISDLDAGAIPVGEGSWQLNPVHYLQLPGGTTDAQYVCPLIAPVFAADLGPADPDNPSCEFNAPPYGMTSAPLSIFNLGNDELNEGGGPGISIQDFPGPPTLSMPQVGPYTIADGGPAFVQTVTMAGNDAPEGLYTGIISISHNASNVPSPWLDTVYFFVFENFYCTKLQNPWTGRAGNGSIALNVGNDGSFATGPANGAFWRAIDSSASISSGSLLLAHGAQGPDTTVWMAFGSAQNNGANGFRVQGEFFIDTSTYWSGSGYARGGVYMVTRDSVMGINMSWYFPQDPNADEVVYANYLIFPGPHFTGTPITDVTLGMIADFDVIPAQRDPIDTMQEGTHNHAEPGDLARALAYVRGTVKPGSNAVGQNDPRRWTAGVAMPTGYEGAYIGNFARDVGQSMAADGLIYSRMTSMSGGTIQIYSPAVSADTDLYIITCLEKNQTYESAPSTYRATTVHSHTLILASDSISSNALKQTIDDATSVVAAGTFEGCAVCPCRHDPNCDGTISDVLDVIKVIGRAWQGQATPPDEDLSCNFNRCDVDCSGAVDAVDIGKVIDIAFRGAIATQKYVDPCTKWRP